MLKMRVPFLTVIPISCVLMTLVFVPGADAAKKYLELWDTGAAANMHGKGLLAVYDAWNKKHPELPIKRTYVPADSARDKLATAIAAGRAPDLVYFDRFLVPQVAAKNMLTALDPYIKNSKTIKSKFFWSPAWNETQYAGKHWAIPHQIDVRALVIMDKIAKQSGLNPDNPPKTLDDMTVWAAKMTTFDASGRMTRFGFAPTRGNWYYYGWLWDFGGDLLSSDKKKVAFNSPEGRAALNWIVDYTNRTLRGFDSLKKVESKFQGGIYDPKGPIQQEQLGMEIEGDWVLWQMKTYAPKVEYTLAPIPTKAEKKPLTWVGGWSWAIPKGSKQTAGAWKFIEFQGSEEGQALFGRVSGRIPAVRSAALDKDFAGLDKRMPKLIDLAETGIYRPTTPIGGVMWDTLNSQMMAKVISGKTSPEQALAWAADIVQKEINRYKERL